MSRRNIPATLAGANFEPDSATVVDMLPLDANGYHTMCRGQTVPDGLAGYCLGCIFQHTDGAAGSLLYCNEGTVLVADFDVITVA